MSDHFDDVNNRYREKGGSSEEVPDVDQRNELTKSLRKGKR